MKKKYLASVGAALVVAAVISFVANTGTPIDDEVEAKEEVTSVIYDVDGKVITDSPEEITNVLLDAEGNVLSEDN